MEYRTHVLVLGGKSDDDDDGNDVDDGGVGGDDNDGVEFHYSLISSENMIEEQNQFRHHGPSLLNGSSLWG